MEIHINMKKYNLITIIFISSILALDDSNNALYALTVEPIEAINKTAPIITGKSISDLTEVALCDYVQTNQNQIQEYHLSQCRGII